MSDFIQFKEDIEKQIKALWSAYDKNGYMVDIIYDFKHYYGNHENSINHYNIDYDLLNGSYREGSVWVLERLTKASVYDKYDTIYFLKDMSKDNKIYLQQLISIIMRDIDDDDLKKEAEKNE